VREFNAKAQRRKGAKEKDRGCVPKHQPQQFKIENSWTSLRRSRDPQNSFAVKKSFL
jgi:hypothetical protein